MRIAVVFSNIRQDTIRLQPGRYVTEIVAYLQESGNPTTLITDTGSAAPHPSDLNGAAVHTVDTVKVIQGWENRDLKKIVLAINPDVLLWGIGQSSFWHLSWPDWINCQVVGLFTSPVYAPQEIIRLGFKEFWHNPKFYAFFLFSAFAPHWLARRVLNHPVVSGGIVLSQDAKQRLQSIGVNSQKLQVIPPGVDFQTQSEDLLGGLNEGDGKINALYMGSPQFYRGPDIAIKAIAQLRNNGISARLLILSRGLNGQFAQEEQKLHMLIEDLNIQTQVALISGFLSQAEIKRHLSESDLILLPFKLIPSDMPLTVLEAMQFGKPVITSSIGSSVELLEEGRGLLVNPNRADELAESIQSLIESPALQEALSISAQKYIKTWPTWQTVGHRVQNLLVGVLAAKRAHD